jgi:hypothetical protein
VKRALEQLTLERYAGSALHKAIAVSED